MKRTQHPGWVKIEDAKWWYMDSFRKLESRANFPLWLFKSVGGYEHYTGGRAGSQGSSVLVYWICEACEMGTESPPLILMLRVLAWYLWLTGTIKIYKYEWRSMFFLCGVLFDFSTVVMGHFADLRQNNIMWLQYSGKFPSALDLHLDCQYSSKSSG